MTKKQNKKDKEIEAGIPFKRFMNMAKPEWKNITAGTFFLILGSSMSLLYPQAIRIIMDEALNKKNFATIDQATIGMTIIFLIQGVATIFRAYLFTISGERIVAKLRTDLYQKIISQEIGFFDQRRTGELINRLASDTTVLQNTVSVNISMVLRNIAQVSGGIALLLYTSTTLAFIMLSVVPIVVVAALFFGRQIRRFSRKVQDALAKATEVAEETISGIRTVRAFSQEEAETKRYQKSVEESFQLAKGRTKAASIFAGTASFAGYGAIAIVFWYGARLVVNGGMTIGDLTSFVLYTLIVAFSLGALGSLWANFMSAAGAAERVFQLMDRDPLIPNKGGLTPESIEGKIEFKNVAFHYPSRTDVTVLKDLQFEINPGEIVALVGSSGGGKSTIVSLLSRFYDPTKGEITIDKHALPLLDASWLRQQIGVVAQEPILFSTSIMENILYGNDKASQEEIEQAAKTANAHDFIMSFPEQYETKVGERGVQLSGGQKQRVAIARAVLKNPRILILDEATSALDAESEHLVKEALDRLMKDRTTLIIAHRLSTVKDANRVFVIGHGTIAQQGTHKQLMEQEGIYKKLIEHQFVTA